MTPIEELGEATAVAFDADLRVISWRGQTPPGIAPAGGASEPPSIADAFRADDEAELEAACRSALGGTSRTLVCSVSGGSASYLVKIGPGEESGGRALWMEATEIVDRGRRQSERASELEAIWLTSRALARCGYWDDTRSTICESTATSTGAPVTFLLEPGDDELIVTASFGAELEDNRVPMAELSGAVVAMRTGGQRFSPSPDRIPGAAGELVAATGAGSVIWQPISRGKTVRGVVAACFEESREHPEPRAARMMETLAVEAAVAIDRASSISRLVEMARKDVLTGLFNRRGWDDALARQLALASRSGDQVTVVMVDLAGFGEFNDRHGHPAGDRLLLHVATSWLPLIRAGDVLARHGGDEFCLLLPGCDEQQVLGTVGRLMEAVADRVEICVGIASWDGEEPPGLLTERATNAMVDARRRGPGTVMVNDPVAIPLTASGELGGGPPPPAVAYSEHQRSR